MLLKLLHRRRFWTILKTHSWKVKEHHVLTYNSWHNDQIIKCGLQNRNHVYVSIYIESFPLIVLFQNRDVQYTQVTNIQLQFCHVFILFDFFGDFNSPSFEHSFERKFQMSEKLFGSMTKIKKRSKDVHLFIIRCYHFESDPPPVYYCDFCMILSFCLSIIVNLKFLIHLTARMGFITL